MDVVRDFQRGAVRLHVLHHGAEREVTGAWMAAELAEHGYRISPGTLYPLLHDLEDAELLTSQERVDDGHAVRCYTTTEQGLATLADARRAIRELATELLPADEPEDSQRHRTPGARGDRPTSLLVAEIDKLISRDRSDDCRRRDLQREAVTEVLSGLRSLLAEGQ